MSQQALSNFQQRLKTSSILALGVIAAIIAAPYPPLRPVFACSLAVLISLALSEFFSMVMKQQHEPLQKGAQLFSFIFVVGTYFLLEAPSLFPFFLPFLFLGWLALFLPYLKQGENPLVGMGATVLGIVYIVLPLTSILALLYIVPEETHGDPRWWLLYLIAVTKIADMGAYVVGKKWGRRKLAPYISPNKTIEGFWGGLFASIFLSGLFFFFLAESPSLYPRPVAYWESLLLGAFIGVLGQLGDLVESLMKRNMGVKDSGQIPGLGGVLDILDSIIFAAPTLTLYLFLRT